MSDSASFFPGDRLEALTMLYLQNQDLSGKSPEEIQTMYYETYYRLQKDRRAKSESGWLKAQKES